MQRGVHLTEYGAALSHDGQVLLTVAENDPSTSCVTAWRRGGSVVAWTAVPVGSRTLLYVR